MTKQRLALPRLNMTSSTCSDKQQVPLFFVVEVWACVQGLWDWAELQVIHDPEAHCLTLTSALFLQLGLDKTSERLDDSHECNHALQQASIELSLRMGMRSDPHPFCILESNGTFAVMTGRETCWERAAYPKCVAGLVRPPMSKGKYIPVLLF